MPQDVDGSGLISLIWAAWLYWWLYTWLDRFSPPEQGGREHSTANARGSIIDAVPFPPSVARTSQDVEPWMVAEVLRRDGAATLDEFLARALAEYERIVAAFDCGDRDTLRASVSADVYRVFADAIATREARREDAETIFSRIEPPKLVGVVADGAHIEVSVLFVGEMFRLFRDAAGQIVGGRENRRQIADIWTFERTASSGKDAWRLVATEAGG